MSGRTIDILWLSLGGLVGLSALWLMARALWADRSRGRRRCPRCWYDMSGVTGLQCSECGKVAASERRLFKTRRRLRGAVVALAISVVSIAVPAAVVGGLKAWRFAPGWVLVLAGEGDSFMRNGLRPVDAELVRRMKAGELSDAQWGVLIDRSVNRTDQFASAMLYTRAAWPADVPIVVGGKPDPNSLCFGCRGLDGNTTLKLRLLTTRDGTPGEWIDSSETILMAPHPIGIPKTGVRSIDVEVKMCASPDRLLWHGVRTLAVVVGGVADDVLKPVASPEVDAGVREYLSPAINIFPSYNAPGRREGRVVVDNRTQREKQLGRYIAIGMHARVLRDGREVARCSFAAQPPLMGMHCGNESTTCSVGEGWEEKSSPGEIMASTWEIECTGDQSLAFCDYDWWGTQEHSFGRGDFPYREPTEYWAGSFRIAVRPMLARER